MQNDASILDVNVIEVSVRLMFVFPYSIEADDETGSSRGNMSYYYGVVWERGNYISLVGHAFVLVTDTDLCY
jgi:hypothetical protein